MNPSFRILGSVGFGGHNRRDDTTTVQTLLNDKMPAPSAPLKVDGACGPKTVFAIREYQRRVLRIHSPDGLIAPDGMTLRSLGGVVSSVVAVTPSVAAVSSAGSVPASVGGHKYTSSPNEFVTTRTTPTSREVVAALRLTWPQLTETGARTLTSQFMTETGHGKFCFNWNLGNVKASEAQPHMYLKNVWECLASSKATQAITNGGGLARAASPDEIKKHGWRGNGTIVVFEPPHPQCRFRAYASLTDGATKWVEHHQRIAQKNSAYLALLNGGKTNEVARALKQAHYFTADETAYGVAMTKNKAEIDRVLGAI